MNCQIGFSTHFLQDKDSTEHDNFLILKTPFPLEELLDLQERHDRSRLLPKDICPRVLCSELAQFIVT